MVSGVLAQLGATTLARPFCSVPFRVDLAIDVAACRPPNPSRPQVSPVCLVLVLFVRVFLIGASISDKCARVPALVNSLSFGPGKEDQRLLLTEYVARSDAGFYVNDVRLIFVGGGRAWGVCMGQRQHCTSLARARHTDRHRAWRPLLRRRHPERRRRRHSLGMAAGREETGIRSALAAPSGPAGPASKLGLRWLVVGARRVHGIGSRRSAIASEHIAAPATPASSGRSGAFVPPSP